MTQEKDSKDKFSRLRKRAEEVLDDKSSDREDISALSPEEVQRLVHELRVHQIELEMQNEDLRQAQVKLEELKDRYLDLYDFAPVGYLTLNEKGLILEANLTAVRLLGEERQTLIKRPFSRFVGQEFGDAYYLYLQKVFEAQTKQTCEIELTKKDGTQFYAQLESIAIQDENGQFSWCRTIVSDISERKRVEGEKQALLTSVQEGKERLFALVDSIADEVWFVDTQKRFTLANAAALREFCLPDSVDIDVDKLVKGLEVLRADRSPRPFEEAPPLRALGGEVVRNLEEVVRTPASGELRYRQVSSAPVRDSKGCIIGAVSVVRDVTDLRKSEEAVPERENRLTNYLNSINEMGLGIFVVDRDYKIRHMNPPMVQWFGDHSGKVCYESVAGLSAPCPYCQLSNVINGSKVVHYEPTTPDGKTFRIVAAPVRENDGSISKMEIIADITDGKRTEERLKRSEEKYRTLFEESFDGLFITSPGGKILDINKKGVAMFGYDRKEEMLSLDLERDVYAHPPDRMRILSMVNAQGTAEYEVVVKKKNGEEMITYCALIAEKDERGVITSYRGIIRDITDPKRAEEKLVSSEKAYRTLAENIPGIVYRVHFNDHPSMELFNNQVESITGFTSAELTIGEVCSIDPLILSEDRPKVVELVKESFSQNQPFHIEYRIRHKNGATRHLLEYGRPVLGSGGAPSFIDGVIFDVTERRTAELDLRASEERFKGVFQNASVGIDLVDGLGRIVEANHSFAQMLGYSADELLKMTILDITHPEDVEDSKHRHHNMVEGKTDAYRFEKRYVRKDGEVIWADVSVSAVRGPDGVYEATIGVISDITARKRAEESLFAAKHDWEDTFNSINDSITIHDKDFNIIQYNTAAKRLLGLSNLETTDVIKCYQYYHGKDCPPELCPSCKCLQTGQQAVSELYEPHLGMFVEITAIPRFASDGEMLGLVHIVRDVTERKKAEEDLRESEERFRQAFENANIGVCIVDTKGNLRRVNREMCNIWGYSKSELESMNVKAVTHPEDVDVSARFIGRALAGEIDRDEFEKRYIRKDGRVVWGNVTSSLVRDGQGNPLYFISHVQDISYKKQAEDFLRESEQRFRLLYEQSPGPYQSLDAEGNILDVNNAWLAELGYDRSEVIGHWFGDFLAGEGPKLFLERFTLFKERGETHGLVFEMRRKDGAVILASFEGRIAKDEEGVFHRTHCVFTNVTERRRAQDALEFERNQLLSIFESMNAFITVIDPTTYEILYANKFTEDLYGEKLVGRICYERLAGLDTPCGHCRIENIMELNGQPYEWEHKNPLLERDLLSRDRMIRWPDGREVKLQIAIDITDRKEAQQEQDRLRAQLFQAQKMESIGTLAGGIAHDFNNILTVVLGFSELLLSGKDERDQSYQDLQKINQAARNGADLVRSILAFGRKADITLKSLDLNHEVKQIKKLLGRTIPKMIDIELNLGREIPRVNADPVQIEQMLLNLAVNASHAMADGGKLTIETQRVTLDEEYSRLNFGATSGEYTMLSVSDTGHGMDQETLSHIFEPFFTTKETGEGTGLGLATVYGLVKQHGGYITCYSEPGEGTTFKIYFPAVEMEMNPDVAKTAIMPAFGTETILLVDDEEFIRALGKRILEKSGYKVITAADGREALDLYKSQKDKISLVILDLMMPVMGGKECLQELLKIEPQVKIIVASGFAASGQTKEVLDSGANASVRKPYEMKQMLRAVRKVLDET